MQVASTARQQKRHQMTIGLRKIYNIIVCFPQKDNNFNYLCGPWQGPPNIATPAIFQAVVRDIGESFQLAITTPRLYLIGYGNATAQS